MRPGRLTVHVCLSHRAIGLAFIEQHHDIIDAVNRSLGLTFKNDASFGIFSYLEFGLLRWVQQIVYLLIVDLTV